MSHRNAFGQEIGAPVPGWVARPKPPRRAMVGSYCAVEPLDPARHAPELHAANSVDRDGRMWTYLPYGPFERAENYRAWADWAAAQEDPLFHAILDAHGHRAGGVASYQRIDSGAGVIEIGHIALSPSLQRRAAATEAMFLMMRRIFEELGYRRCEWKCDALNTASRRAAERLGFRYEGCFRQATIYKGRNRDTAWYAITDGDWPALRGAFMRWLDPANFDAAGAQLVSLSNLTASLV